MDHQKRSRTDFRPMEIARAFRHYAVNERCPYVDIETLRRSPFFIMSTPPIAWAVDDLYRCTDGTFTNRVERQCQPYESTGIVRVQVGPSEKTDAPKPAFAEVKVVEESMKHQAAGPVR